MVIINKSTNNKCQRRCGGKGTLLHCWWELNWCSLYKTVLVQSKKLKIELPYDLSIPLLGIYLDKTINQKYTCGALAVSQWDQKHFGDTGTWVQSLAQNSGLRIHCCHRCSLVCSCGLDLIPGPGTPYAMGRPKTKNKKQNKPLKKHVPLYLLQHHLQQPRHVAT